MFSAEMHLKCISARRKSKCHSDGTQQIFLLYFQGPRLLKITFLSHSSIYIKYMNLMYFYNKHWWSGS